MWSQMGSNLLHISIFHVFTKAQIMNYFFGSQSKMLHFLQFVRKGVSEHWLAAQWFLIHVVCLIRVCNRKMSVETVIRVAMRGYFFSLLNVGRCNRINKWAMIGLIQERKFKFIHIYAILNSLLESYITTVLLIN